MDVSFTGTQGSWKEKSIPLSNYSGSEFADVRFRFRFVSDSTQTQTLMDWFIDDIWIISGATGVAVTKPIPPVRFSLYQNYPNPFNSSTIISYQLPVNSHVELSIYNLLGQKVVTLVSVKQSSGIHKFNWDARGLANGVYLYRLEAGDPSASSGQVFVQTKKLLLMR